jgi:hypothetical protein
MRTGYNNWNVRSKWECVFLGHPIASITYSLAQIMSFFVMSTTNKKQKGLPETRNLNPTILLFNPHQKPTNYENTYPCIRQPVSKIIPGR